MHHHRNHVNTRSLSTVVFAMLGFVACDADFDPRDVEPQGVDREQAPDLGDGESDGGGSEGGDDVGPGDDAVCPADCGGEVCEGCTYVEPTTDVEVCDAEADEVPPADDGSEGSTTDAIPEPWGDSVGLEQDDDLDLFGGLDPSADKKGGKCYPPLPAGAVGIGGTKLISIRWMEQFRTATCSNPWVNAPLTFNQLTDKQVDQIIANCKNQPTELDKLLCVARAVDVAVDGTEDKSGDYVCRHHMGSLYKVLKKMGYGNSATGSMTHAWNEVEIDTNGDGKVDTIVVLDSYNDIHYTVPK